MAHNFMKITELIVVLLCLAVEFVLLVDVLIILRSDYAKK